MESVIIISIKLKYDNQKKCFKWHLDEGWNGRGAAAAPSKGEINNAHKGTDTRSGDRTNIGIAFDAPQLALPVPTNTNGGNNKKDDGSFSFGAALLAPPKSGGVREFYFGLSSSSAINGDTGSVSWDKRVKEKKEDSSSAPAADFYFGPSTATKPVVIAPDGVKTDASRFSFGAAPSSSVMSPPPKGSEAKDPAPEPAFSFGVASLSSAATPTPCQLSPRHRPQTSYSEPENSELQLNNTGKKIQDKNELIIHNYLRNIERNQMNDMIKESDPNILVHLDHEKLIHYNPLIFLEDNNSTAPLQKGGTCSGWFTAEETSWTNTSINFLNFHNSTLYTEGSACSIIAITVI